MRRYTGKQDRKSAGIGGRRLDDLSATVNDLYQKAVQNEKIMRRYQQFELQLLSNSSLDDLLGLLLCNAVDYFQLDQVELWLYDPQNTLTVLLSEETLAIPSLHLERDANSIKNLYSKQPAVRLLATMEESGLPVFGGEALRSAALLPLVRHGVLVGSLHFGARGHQRFATDKSTDFIDHLASIVSLCLENAVNQERLHHLSMYDTLTQVKNRRAFHLALDKEISRASRSGDPLSLLFVDLDYFKKINDSYGHPAGDKVLKDVAQYVNDMLRKTDHVCRYGGEEFALLLPNCGQQRAMEIGERIRQQVSDLDIETPESGGEGCHHIRVTLSIGVCCWLPAADMAEGEEMRVATELVASSDRGVYQSKAAGRNCIHYMAMT